MENSSPNQPHPINKISLDEVFAEISHWRDNKGRVNEGVPDELWKKIFTLAETHTERTMKSIFKLNTKQYKMKHSELCPSKINMPIVHAQPEPVDEEKLEKRTESFCEIKIDPPSVPVPSLTAQKCATAGDVKTLKSTRNNFSEFIDTKTLIVECIHPNGHRLKIHATTHSLHEIFQEFNRMGVAA